MTEREYEKLTKEWDELEVKRQALSSQHDADAGTFFEDEVWYDQHEAIGAQQEALQEKIDAYEEAELNSIREFEPPVVDGVSAAPGSFAWDRWEQWAKDDGIAEELAQLGRAVIREAYQHNWPGRLKTECGWHDDGEAMLRLAKEEPDRARIRWKYLLESDGDFHWCR
ncbi:hypothetical protein [Botrimarina mediterranea]|uniref:hypothetical protein n=1 Tax=Botrimarina mediterranea TaxID=2528022 RepID=UPI001187B99F|nr:hypothetical protein K2D_46940 [Planctomycetes bacterium K2D]